MCLCFYKYVCRCVTSKFHFKKIEGAGQYIWVEGRAGDDGIDSHQSKQRGDGRRISRRGKHRMLEEHRGACRSHVRLPPRPAGKLSPRVIREALRLGLSWVAWMAEVRTKS